VPDSAPKTRWMLDQNALNSLLAALHPDREQASHAYEALRERLIRFFEWNQADLPDELADEVLDRLARRLSDRNDEVLDPGKFAAGIARLLLKEYWRDKRREEEALAALVQGTEDAIQRERERADAEERMTMLEQCLEALPEGNRALIQRYFNVPGRGPGQYRRLLAEEHGISPNALRNRVMRIRMELERTFQRRYFERNSDTPRDNSPKSDTLV